MKRRKLATGLILNLLILTVLVLPMGAFATDEITEESFKCIDINSFLSPINTTQEDAYTSYLVDETPESPMNCIEFGDYLPPMEITEQGDIMPISLGETIILILTEENKVIIGLST